MIRITLGFHGLRQGPGNNAQPKPKTRRKLAEALGVDPAKLIE